MESSASRALRAFLVSARHLHTTRTLLERPKQRVARAVKERNNSAHQQRIQAQRNTHGHPALGHPISEPSAWPTCRLASVIITRDQLDNGPLLALPPDPQDPLETPKYSAFGLQEEDNKLLFDSLPHLSSESSYINDKDASKFPLDKKQIEHQLIQDNKALMLAKFTDLRNTNADGLAYENRRRIVQAFSTQSQPHDTGRSEVQAALLTYKIRNLWDKLKKKDVTNMRHLVRLVHERARVLKYLKRKDYRRWEHCLQDLALRPDAVEGELDIRLHQ